MRKLIVSVFLILTLVGKSYSFAFVAIPAWYWGASLALHVGAGLAYIAYAMKSGGSSRVLGDGSVVRDSSVSWTDLKSDGSPEMHEKSVNAKMDFNKVKELSDKKNPDGTDKYPKVKNALKGQFPPCGEGSTVGTVCTLGGKQIKVDSYGYNNYNILTQPLTDATWGTNPVYGQSYITGTTPPGTPSGLVQYKAYITFRGPLDNSPPPPVTPQVAKNNLTDLGTDNAKSLYQDELDKMFQDPDYVPTFSDDTTGLPYTPPADALTQAQLDQANKNTAAKEAAAAQAAANQSAVDSSQSAANASQAARDQAASNAASNPNDAAAQQKMKDAEAAYRKALADLEAAKAKQAQDAAAAAKEDALTPPSVPGDNTYNTVIETPQKKSITQLLTTLITNSPLSTIIRSFSVSASAPVKSVSLGNIYGREMALDFSRWESFMQGCGVVLLSVCSAYCVLVVFRGFRG